MARSTKVSVTVPTVTFTSLSLSIADTMKSLTATKNEAGKLYASASALFDSISKEWTQVKFNKIKNEEGAKKEFTAAGISEGAMVKILEGRKVILEALENGDRKMVWQAVSRHSIGYLGASPLHPDVKPTKKEKGEAGEKGEGEKGETETLVDMIAKNPQSARIVLSQIHAGLAQGKKLRKANKMSVAGFDEVLAMLEDLTEAVSKL